MCVRDYEVEIESLKKECERLIAQLEKQQKEYATLKDDLNEAKTQILELEEESNYYQGQAKAYEFCIEKLCRM